MPSPPPPPGAALAELLPGGGRGRTLASLLGRPDLLAPGGRYGHWSVRLAAARSREEADQWIATRLARHLARTDLGSALPDGTSLGHTMPPPAVALLSRLDRAVATVPGPGAWGHPQRAESARRAAARSEAVASASLAGHANEPDAVVEVLLQQRGPGSAGEAWATGVHHCLRAAADERTEPVTPSTLLELHGLLCAGTPAATRGGRLRSAREDPEHGDELGAFDLRPPAARELERRLETVCALVEAGDERQPYVHPLIRAATARLLIACDRPFAAANALMARIVWRLALARTGWTVGDLLAPSRVLLSVRGRYPRALHYTLTDDGDATYFILFQLEVLGAALDHATEALAARLAAEERIVAAVRQRRGGFTPSYRQAAVLARAARYPDARFLVAGHQRAHGTVYETARSDLLELAAHGLLAQQREGRAFVFRPASGLARTVGGRA